MTNSDAPTGVSEFAAGRFGRKPNGAPRALTPAERTQALRTAAIREQSVEQAVSDLARHSRG